jgi:excinuclease UvrABC ATPase subunit
VKIGDLNIVDLPQRFGHLIMGQELDMSAAECSAQQRNDSASGWSLMMKRETQVYDYETIRFMMFGFFYDVMTCDECKGLGKGYRCLVPRLHDSRECVCNDDL